jgi:hypothetical protein
VALLVVSIELKDETGNNGATPRFLPGKLLEYTWSAELTWSVEVFEGMRGVPSLNTFCRPWGKPMREEETENGCSRECASSIYLQRTSHFEILDLALFR